MRLWIDPARLAAYKTTIQDIKSALDRENIELPGGKVRGNMTELTVRAIQARFRRHFNNLIISQESGRIVRFKDIGYAILGPDVEESISRKTTSPA